MVNKGVESRRPVLEERELRGQIFKRVGYEQSFIETQRERELTIPSTHILRSDEGLKIIRNVSEVSQVKGKVVPLHVTEGRTKQKPQKIKMILHGSISKERSF